MRGRKRVRGREGEGERVRGREGERKGEEGRGWYLGEVLVLDEVHYILVLLLRLRRYTVGPGGRV